MNKTTPVPTVKMNSQHLLNTHLVPCKAISIDLFPCSHLLGMLQKHPVKPILYRLGGMWLSSESQNLHVNPSVLDS